MLTAAILLSLVGTVPPDLTQPERVPPAPSQVRPVTVKAARFLSNVTDGKGRTRATETRTIPYRVGTSCYSWEILIEPRDTFTVVEERFTLPAPARQWGGVDAGANGTTSVNEDRRIASTTLGVEAGGDTITHGWCVAPGDPRGPYRIEVYDDTRLLHRFDFTVG